MRIFKHRGDIYFSKANKEKSNEQKILLAALVGIVSFTIIFVLALSIKNDFSAKKFFAPENADEISTAPVYEYNEMDLPQVSGKENFVTMIYEDNTLLFAAIVQVDLDTTSYKASLLKPETEFDNTTLENTFSNSGVEGVKAAIELNMGINIDHYISMRSLDYRELFADLGSIRYSILNDIKYKNSNSPVTYSLKIDAGEQNIDGKEFVNLIRYYLENDNTSLANELFLAALSQQLNDDSFTDREELFKTFVTASETDITIRNFAAAIDGLQVICYDQTSMGVYNAAVNYDNNKITDDSLVSVKGYFVK